MRSPLLSLAVLAAVLSLGGGSAAQQAPAPPAAPPAAAGVNVPNFWDPRARLERPAAGDIGPIRFLTSDDFPPFSFRDRRGMLIGFDVELAQAICKVLRAPCAIQARPFDTLRAGLADGSGNAILAGFDPERAGAEGLIASQAYLKIPARFVARNEAALDPAAAPPESLVSVVCGSAHQVFLERFFPNMKIACAPNASAGLDELKAGRVAAYFGDALGLSFWLHGEASQKCCAFSGGPYMDDRLFGGGLSIVMRSEDRKLKFAIDYALREVYRAGTYEELYLRYFPVSLF